MPCTVPTLLFHSHSSPITPSLTLPQGDGGGDPQDAQDGPGGEPVTGTGGDERALGGGGCKVCVCDASVGLGGAGWESAYA